MATPTADEIIPTRATLILRLKNWGDQVSWQEFYDTYWKLIYGVALKHRLTNAEAQDVVQETMLSVAKNMAGFNYDPATGSFKAWLLNMTRWRMLDQIRKRKNFQQHDSIHDSHADEMHPFNHLMDPTSHELEMLWDVEWKENTLAIAMAKVKRQLDPAQFQIFDFNVNKQWSPEKVAILFKVKVEQVYMAKFRVTELLKTEVERIEAGLR